MERLSREHGAERLQSWHSAPAVLTQLSEYVLMIQEKLQEILNCVFMMDTGLSIYAAECIFLPRYS